MPALNALYAQYRDRVAFPVVYIQEAHPIDAWQVGFEPAAVEATLKRLLP